MVTAHDTPLVTLRRASNARVDATLAALFESRPAVEARLEAAMRHGLLVGGKRLRPLLVLLAARSLGYEGDKHITLATLIEFMHTSTLLHDDVVDESHMRRGKKTANDAWGNAPSVLSP